MSEINERLDDIETVIMDLQRVVEELSQECFKQSKQLERLERENKALKESLEANVKPLSEETPPPHY